MNMKTTLLELIDFEKVNSLLEGFNKTTGFVTAIIDLEGNVLSKSGWRQICTEFHRAHPETAHQCRISDTDLANKKAEGLKYNAYQCFNGLVDVVVPLIINEEHIANLFSGQFFFEKPDRDYFIKQAEKYGFDKAKCLKALDDVPVVSKEKVQTAMDFLQNMTQLIGEMTLQKQEQIILNTTLKENEEKMQSIYRVAPAGIGVVSDRVLKAVNPRICEMTGYTRDELIDKSARILYPTQEDFEFVGKEKYAQIQRDGIGKVETRWKKKDGKIIDVLLSSAPIEQNDYSKGVTFTALDITQRKQTEVQLRESESRFKALHNASFGGIIIHDKGLILECNMGLSEITGYSLDELIGMDGLLLIAPESRAFVMDNILSGYEKPYEAIGLRKNGELYPLRLEARNIPYKGKTVRNVEFRDVTDIKQAENTLRESEKHSAFLAKTAFELVELTSIEEIYKFTVQKLFDLLEDSLFVALVEFNTSTNRWKMKHIEGVNEKLTRLTKLIRYDIRTIEGDISTKYHDKITSGKLVELDFDLPGLFNNKLSSAIGTTVKKMFSIEKMYCIAYDQDEQIIGNITFTTHKNTKPINVKLIEAFIQQVANFVRKQKAEERLKESEDRFKKLSSFTFEGIIIHNNAIAIDANQSAIEMLGYERDEIVGMNVFELIHTDYHEIAKNNLKKQISTTYQIVGIRKDGSTFDAEIQARNIAYEGEYFRVACVRDITERKREEKIRHLQYNIARATITSSNLSELFESVKKELNQVIDAKNLVIASYDEETGMMFANVTNDEKDEIHEWTAEKSLTGYVIRQDKPLLLQKSDILQLHKKGVIDLIGTTAEAWLGVPLKVEGKIFGALVIQNYYNKDIYDQSSVEIMEMISHELSLFIDWERSEEKANKLSRAVEQSAVSVMITNPKGHIEYVNPFFTKLTGYIAEEVKGKTPSILKSGYHSKAFYQNFWDTIKSGKDWEGEFYNKTKTGEYYWANAIVTPVVNKAGEITNYVSIKEDITEKKAMIQALVAAKEKAQESDKLKTAFLNNISHEIRTPLNGILGFADLLQDEDIGVGDKQQMLSIVQQSSNRLLNTITDYIDLARIVSGTLDVNKKEFLLTPFFEEIIDEIKPSFALKGLDFNAELHVNDAGITIYSDPVLIRKLFNIIFDNALKFTRKGSVSCGYKLTDGFVEFFVKDTGIGIAAEKLDSIFKIFTQEDYSDTRGYEGSGIGLSIANGLVNLLGGNITVESEKGKGALFVFTIPHTATKKLQKNESAGLSSKRAGKHFLILIVEDDFSNAMFIKAILKKGGYNFLLAKNGQEAVSVCKQNMGINLVLMDIKMPVMDGVKATKLIKEFRPELPIIATTAYAQTGDEHLFLASGFQYYIAKPIQKEILFQLIDKYEGKPSN